MSLNRTQDVVRRLLMVPVAWLAVWGLPAVIVAVLVTLPGKILSITGYVGFKIGTGVAMGLFGCIFGFIGMSYVYRIDRYRRAWLLPVVLNLVFCACLLLEPRRNASSTITAVLLTVFVSLGVVLRVRREESGPPLRGAALVIAATVLGIGSAAAICAGLWGVRDYRMNTGLAAPVINQGDVVWAARVTARGQFDEGDVVVLRASGTSGVLLRRVVAVEGETMPGSSEPVEAGKLFVSAEGGTNAQVAATSVSGIVFAVVSPPGHWSVIPWRAGR